MQIITTERLGAHRYANLGTRAGKLRSILQRQFVGVRFEAADPVGYGRTVAPARSLLGALVEMGHREGRAPAKPKGL